MPLALHGHRPYRGLCRAFLAICRFSRSLFCSLPESDIFSVSGRVVFLLAILLGTARMNAWANDIEVTGVTFPTATIAGTGTSRTIKVNFTLSWKNSWRTSSGPANWDAAWVFVKFRKNNSTTWEHAWLSTTSTDHEATQSASYTHGNATIQVGTTTISGTERGMGAFIYRSANGSGNVSWSTSLRWNFGAVGQTGGIEVRVFATEMVYVPQGAFYVGSGGTDYHEWGSLTDGSTSFGGGANTNPQGRTSIPFLITSENAIDIDDKPGKLWGMSNDLSINQPERGHHIGNSTDAAVSLPAAFPKGFGAFYCMKYEMSQAQYRDYLNTLTYQQQTLYHFNGTPQSPVGTKINNSAWHYIEIKTPGNSTTNTPAVYGVDQSNNNVFDESNDGMTLAASSGTFYTLASYLDWSGLRPMTELEYEKACRGTLTPVPNEYAWGTTTIIANTTISNRGFDNETVTDGNFSGKSGTYDPTSIAGFTAQSTSPTRVGAFAKNGTSRVDAGATYYGIMDMTGGHWENVINVARNEGRAYTGLHGDGSLSSTGHHNVTNWPSTPPYEGAGTRGGAWSSNWNHYMSFTVSGRNIGAYRSGIVEGQNFWEVIGGRGVRSAQ